MNLQNNHFPPSCQAGWISCVVTGGDNCACVSRSENQVTLTLYQLMRAARDINKQLHNITQELVKRIQISGRLLLNYFLVVHVYA